MSEKLIAPRLCAECREPFTPRMEKQRYCPRPARCSYQGRSRLQRGKVPEAAVAGRRRIAAAIRERKLQGRFGTLTEREEAIFAFAHAAGYDEGYQIAYAPMKRKAS